MIMTVDFRQKRFEISSNKTTRIKSLHIHMPHRKMDILRIFMLFWQKKIRSFPFWTIDELEGVLTIFYEKYNNERLHSSVCNLPPNIFLESWNKGLIEQKRDEIKQKKRTFKLKKDQDKKFWGNIKI